MLIMRLLYRHTSRSLGIQMKQPSQLPRLPSPTCLNISLTRGSARLTQASWDATIRRIIKRFLRRYCRPANSMAAFALESSTLYDRIRMARLFRMTTGSLPCLATSYWSAQIGTRSTPRLLRVWSNRMGYRLCWLLDRTLSRRLYTETSRSSKRRAHERPAQLQGKQSCCKDIPHTR